MNPIGWHPIGGHPIGTHIGKTKEIIQENYTNYDRISKIQDNIRNSLYTNTYFL